MLLVRRVPERNTTRVNRGIIMPDETHEAASPQSQEREPETDARRAKTPLELVRERQAQMRGQKPTSGRGSNERQPAGSANLAKRRQHQRRAG